ncbi:LamG-like jellyroll fold domain-containing protein [Algibacillus agarilyticus]|uniref:LamG-like jellyroll fold domain-containing protein n=1 Tax=Algibacillus agarilyticus TaxID=2234133 RepID=UPI000DD0AFE3|nr:LamG-like jellyroll fold domain-containing protein [Algibacillus agarilyticus]
MGVDRTDKFADIREIADAICNQEVTPEQVQELEQLLLDNEEGQQFYYEYIGMHLHMQSTAEQNMEFVYRRMTEEFIMRPTQAGSDELDLQTFNSDAPNSNRQHNKAAINATISATKEPTEEQHQQPPLPPMNAAPQDKKQTKNSMSILVSVLVIVLLIILFILSWFVLNPTTTAFTAEIKQGHLSIVEQGKINAKHIFAGEYKVEQPTILSLQNGDHFQFGAHSQFKLFNKNEIQLKQGSLTITSASGNNIIVHAPSFTLYSNGDALSINLTTDNPDIIVGKNTLLLPSRWRPNHYWAFESANELAIDSAHNAYGKPGIGAKRTEGLLGQGAFQFDNSKHARIDVGSGGGTAPATGSFAVNDGVTIEALIRPEYTGLRSEIDEIFRKDQEDREMRMLLSFQHDVGKAYLRPKGIYQESLSFGLYIVGQGYHELKLPLDGKEGRPTLAELKDGNTYHIAATYHVKTGIKSIYINGIEHASYHYPPGSKMLSGGSGRASIGNNPAKKRWQHEAFSGVIDEVAFYDFALPSYMLKEHFSQIKAGRNYFGFMPSSASLPKQIKIALPPLTRISIDSLTGLPNEVLNANLATPAIQFKPLR